MIQCCVCFCFISEMVSVFSFAFFVFVPFPLTYRHVCVSWDFVLVLLFITTAQSCAAEMVVCRKATDFLFLLVKTGDPILFPLTHIKP